MTHIDYGLPAASAPAHARWRRVRPGLLLLLLVLIAFAPAVSGETIWDDAEYLTENRYVARLSGPGWFWLSPGETSGQWYPMTLTTLWAEYRVWGLWVPGYHVDNILLHAFTTLLVWRILVRLRVPGAWGAAAVFGLHPLAVETVAWVAERKNLLAMAFGLLFIRSYLVMRGVTGVMGVTGESAGPADRPPLAPWKLYGVGLLCFALSLTSKPVFCGAPLVVLVLLWARRALRPRDALLLLPHVALAVAMALACVHFEKVSGGAGVATLGFTPLQRVLIAGTDVVFYAGKFLWPHPLLSTYARWDVARPGAWAYACVAVAAAAPVVLFALRRRVGRRPAAGVAVAGLALGPALGLADFYSMLWSFVADHYAYVALPALAALAVAPVARYAPRAVGRVALAAALITLGALTASQAALYRDGAKLWAHTIRYNPEGWRAHLNMANVLLLRNRPAEALGYAARAVELRPTDAEARLHLAYALYHCGRLEEAAREVRLVRQAEPGWDNAKLLEEGVERGLRARNAGTRPAHASPATTSTGPATVPTPARQ